MGENLSTANWETHTPDSLVEYCMRKFPQDTFKVATDYDQVIYVQPHRIEFKGELEEIGSNMTLAQVKMLIDSIQYSDELFVWTDEAPVSKEQNQEFVDFHITTTHPDEEAQDGHIDESALSQIPGYVPPLGSKEEDGALEPAPEAAAETAPEPQVTPQTAAIKANHPAQVSEKIEMLVLENKDLKTKNDELTSRVGELEKENNELKNNSQPPPPPPPDDLLDGLKEETEQLKKQIEELKGENKKLKDQASAAPPPPPDDILEGIEKENKDLKSKVTDLEKKNKNLNEKLSSAAPPPNEILSELNKQIEGLEKQNEELEGKLEAAEKAGAKKGAAKGKAADDKELKKLQKKIKDLEKQLASARDGGESAGGSDEELEKAKDRIAKYEEMVARMKEQYPEFGSTMQKILLQAELDKRLGKK